MLGETTILASLLAAVSGGLVANLAQNLLFSRQYCYDEVERICNKIEQDCLRREKWLISDKEYREDFADQFSSRVAFTVRSIDRLRKHNRFFSFPDFDDKNNPVIEYRQVLTGDVIDWDHINTELSRLNWAAYRLQSEVVDGVLPNIVGKRPILIKQTTMN